jgi:hypothetical protein
MPLYSITAGAKILSRRMNISSKCMALFHGGLTVIYRLPLIVPILTCGSVSKIDICIMEGFQLLCKWMATLYGQYLMFVTDIFLSLSLNVWYKIQKAYYFLTGI